VAASPRTTEKRTMLVLAMRVPNEST